MSQQVIRIRQGDSIEVLRTLPANSIGAVITDPPYGIAFLGRTWDDPTKLGEAAEAGGETHELAGFQKWAEVWLAECHRVLVPGGVIKVFSATRTFHRVAAAFERVGFQNIDLEAWVYSSGFPKSKNVALAIDKGEGHPNRGRAIPTASTHLPGGKYAIEKLTSNLVPEYEAKSDAGKQFTGYGTALKPAWEPFIIATKGT